jgi:hypothetical protein
MTGSGTAHIEAREIRLPQKEGVAVESSPSVKGQLGVIAKRSYQPGKVIFKVVGPIVPTATKYSFAIALDQHIEPLREDGVSDFGHYLNHSCDPNVIVRPNYENGVPSIDVIARHDIRPGDELAFDYASLEYDVTVANSPCQCGTSTCRAVIHGFRDLPGKVRNQYVQEGIIADYLLSLPSCALATPNLPAIDLQVLVRPAIEAERE